MLGYPRHRSTAVMCPWVFLLGYTHVYEVIRYKILNNICNLDVVLPRHVYISVRLNNAIFLHKYTHKLSIILKSPFLMLASPGCGRRRWMHTLDYTDGHWQCFGKIAEEHRPVTIPKGATDFLIFKCKTLSDYQSRLFCLHIKFFHSLLLGIQ